MAESVVSFVVERFADLLIQEADILYGATLQVQKLQIEMKHIQRFLKDADAKEIRDERVRNLVAEIRDASYDAEDVIDTFILEVATRRRRGGLRRINEWMALHKVGTKMEAIQARIHHLTKVIQTFGIRNIGEGEGTSSTNESRQELIRRSHPHIVDDVIGLKSDSKALVEMLIKEDIRYRVVSIVGMGGLGKTTLAKEVYNHGVIRHHFDFIAWGLISQQSRMRDVIQGILKMLDKSINEEMEIITEEELVEKLYKFLEKRRYLVVLDDIWSTDAWDRLKHAFPNGKAGSKVLLTTRNREVAAYADPLSVPYELRYLNEDESWELLCNKAFPEKLGKGCPPGFEKFRREIGQICGGLPLAVVVVGGLLATKKDIFEWERVLSNISLHLNKGKLHQVLGILALSYNDLPYHLKLCFLYLGMFPDDFAIPVGRLIRLWIAEGFIPQPQLGETMEEVAEQYLVELIDRCMVQAGERSSTRSFKTCRVQDLMRDLCLSKATEENFLGIFNQGNMMVDTSSSVVVVPSLATAKARRYAIHFAEQRYDNTCLFERGASNVRSLLLFVPGFSIQLKEKQLKKMFKDFKLLRVLELEKVEVEGGIPTQIEHLFHLRYLRLEDMCIDLPRSIGNLRNLQTLDLRLFRTRRVRITDTKRIRIPDVIWKMEQLRHLYLPITSNTAHLRIDTLRNLQTLKHAQAGSWIEKGHLAKLSNIRNLRIKDISSTEQVKAVLESPVVGPDCRLYSLNLELKDEMTFPSLTPLSGCPRLSKLSLYGRIGNHEPHHCDFLPPILSKLTLTCSELEQDPMAMLEKMPNLRILYMGTNSYIGKVMICSAQGFPKLEFLQLEDFYGLEEWRVDGGAMPRLRHLGINGCRNLRMVPEGLRFINTLRELDIRQMPAAFEDRLREGGADYYKVQYIPSITTLDTLHEEEM
ncbi:hypothetical protein HHK36_026129 [Tetracentron sinense]|uniref:Uncharacterized protein n=1 Tax=Tetracentron sinense TaxID=13715 RepID=A0A835D721_TETSI|nr:hypothetical protein HHK36_026129 [Tetracentron sinense]